MLKEKNPISKVLKKEIGEKKEDNFGTRLEHYEKNVKPKYKNLKFKGE